MKLKTRNILVQSCSTATLFTTNPTWIILGSNLALREEWPATSGPRRDIRPSDIRCEYNIKAIYNNKYIQIIFFHGVGFLKTPLSNTFLCFRH